MSPIESLEATPAVAAADAANDALTFTLSGIERDMECNLADRERNTGSRWNDWESLVVPSTQLRATFEIQNEGDICHKIFEARVN
jgi:hypothetical protein